MRFALAQGIIRWKVTLFCSAPSFLRNVLQAAKKSELKTIRLIVTGAEKAPADLFAKVKELKNVGIIEGYGITECSPIISLNRPNLPRIGVGQPIPTLEMCTIHPETHEALKEHQEGELCVRGASVFHGLFGRCCRSFY